MGVYGAYFGFAHGVCLLLVCALCQLSAPTPHEALTSVLMPRALCLCSHCTISSARPGMKFAPRFSMLYGSLGSYPPRVYSRFCAGEAS